MDTSDNKWEVGQRLVAVTGGNMARYFVFAVVTKCTPRGYRVREVDHDATEWQPEDAYEQTRTVTPAWQRPIGKTFWISLRGATFARTGQRPEYEFQEFVERAYVEHVDRTF